VVQNIRKALVDLSGLGREFFERFCPALFKNNRYNEMEEKVIVVLSGH